MVKMVTERGRAYCDSLQAMLDSYMSFQDRREQMQNRRDELRQEAEELKISLASAMDAASAEKIAKGYKAAKEQAGDLELLLSVNGRPALRSRLEEVTGEREAAAEYNAMLELVRADNKRIMEEAQAAVKANNAALQAHPYNLARKCKASIREILIG